MNFIIKVYLKHKKCQIKETKQIQEFKALHGPKQNSPQIHRTALRMVYIIMQ